jgi:soluble lytic murein transglycosylase-like protein
MTTKRPRSRKRNKGLLFSAVLAAALALAEPAAAQQVYYYRDAKGVIHFTDAPTDNRYRPFEVKTQIKVGVGSFRMDPALLQPYISAAAKKYRLDPALINAVITVESAFDPYAVSWAGAQGLMQLMPGTADLVGVTNSFSPRQNIMGGCKYLRGMLDRFKGDVQLALAAYNIGPERVAREKKIPDVAETQAYVKRVMEYYNRYKKKT